MLKTVIAWGRAGNAKDVSAPVSAMNNLWKTLSLTLFQIHMKVLEKLPFILTGNKRLML
jgi:hypothetical protein